MTINQLTKKFFNDDLNAWRRQHRYMGYGLFFMEGQYKEFKTQLIELNRYLKYFPIPEDKQPVTSLPEDEILEIIDNAKTNWVPPSPIDFQL